MADDSRRFSQLACRYLSLSVSARIAAESLPHGAGCSHRTSNIPAYTEQNVQAHDPIAEEGGSSLNKNEITQLLQHWRQGDSDALDQLTPLVYDRLRALASNLFRSESGGHTLQPTALVNELFQRLIVTDVDWHDRNHFYALSARMMRRILVNHATAKNAGKRGGNALRITLQEASTPGRDEDIADIIALDEALEGLHALDERKARILEMHYFAGLTYAELADVMELAESTVHQDLRTAKAWLRSRLIA